MAIIKVNNENEFNMLCTLIEDNALTDKKEDIDIIVKNGSIISSGNQYIISSDAQNVSSLDEDNSNVFKRFESFYKSTSIVDSWETIKEKVVNKFFSRRNYLIYNPLFTKKRDEEYYSLIKKYLKAFLPENLYNQDILGIIPKDSVNEQVVYEVSVKFAIKFNGEPVYVINKFYFDDKNNLLPSEISNNMYLNANEFGRTIENSEMSNQDQKYEINSEQIQSFYDQIIELMGTDFKQYLVGNAKKVIEDYANKNDGNMIEVECGAPRFRYVARLKVYLRRFLIINKLTNESLFEVTIDASDRVDFKCLQCGESGICSNNTILVYESDEEGKLVQKYKSFDINNIENPNDYIGNQLALHVRRPLETCHGCDRLICSKTVKECEVCSKPICNNCNSLSHAVRLVSSSNLIHKECAGFCNATLKFVPKTEIRTCKCCGMKYSSDYFNEETGYCNLCDPIVTARGSKDISLYERIYQIHKNIFPIYLRSKFGIANEDINSIIFRMGSSVYIYDKKNLDNKLVKVKRIRKGV